MTTTLDNDRFLKELRIMFFKSRTGGAKNVTITIKPYDGRTKPGEMGAGNDVSVLFRAVHGRNKLSTVVPAEEASNFTILYTTVLLANMDNLERRSKKAEEEKKTKPKPAKKKKRKPATDSVKVESI